MTDFSILNIEKKITKEEVKEAQNSTKVEVTTSEINGVTVVIEEYPSGDIKEKIDELLEKQAIKRLGEYSDIENIIEFYMSDKSNFITGQILYLGGLWI
mgnify:CR=1 FL=1